MELILKARIELESAYNSLKELEKLGINIEVEQDKFNQADIALESKKIYLIKEDQENHAYELFINTLNN